MIIKRLKSFSLEEGKFTGKKPTAKRTFISQASTLTALGAGMGAIAGKGKGALVGAGIGLISGLLTAALTRSVFNSSHENNITTKNIFKEFSKMVDYRESINRSTENRPVIPYNIEQYDLDSNNPKLYDLSVKANEDSIVMYIRPLSKTETNEVSDILDGFCMETRDTDYVSEKLEDDSWIVTMKLKDYESAAELLLELMSECKFRVNFISK